MLFGAGPSVNQAMANMRRDARSKGSGGVSRMSLFFQRYPAARPWIFAASQAAAMLGFHVLLRVAVL